MTFLGCDANGMYVLEYCNPGQIAYQYRTYESFCKEYNNAAPEKNKKYAVWIYNACTAVNKGQASAGTAKTTVTVTTKTGKIKGTDGNLAIRASAGTSGKMIGKIPEGRTCTVYTNKKSGGWIWVKYGSVTGWSCAKYIKY